MPCQEYKRQRKSDINILMADAPFIGDHEGRSKSIAVSGATPSFHISSSCSCSCNNSSKKTINGLLT